MAIAFSYRHLHFTRLASAGRVYFFLKSIVGIIAITVGTNSKPNADIDTT